MKIDVIGIDILTYYVNKKEQIKNINDFFKD